MGIIELILNNKMGNKLIVVSAIAATTVDGRRYYDTLREGTRLAIPSDG